MDLKNNLFTHISNPEARKLFKNSVSLVRKVDELRTQISESNDNAEIIRLYNELDTMQEKLYCDTCNGMSIWIEEHNNSLSEMRKDLDLIEKVAYIYKTNLDKAKFDRNFIAITCLVIIIINFIMNFR